MYLYVKTHNKTGLKYLGQTKTKDPHKYSGSGKYWKLHLKKHGADFSTEIIKECRTKKEIKQWGEFYSSLWDVVNDPSWANLKPESGDGGWGKRVNYSHSIETRNKIGDSRRGVPNPKNSIPRTEEQKEHLRKLNTGKSVPPDIVEKIKQTKKENPFKHSQQTKQKMKKPKSDEHKANMKDGWHEKRKDYKKIWITNGINDMLVDKKSIVPDGWTKGRLVKPRPPSQKGKFWINDGTLNKMSVDVPDGWVKGRLKYERK
jgi:hypothetical protein